MTKNCSSTVPRYCTMLFMGTDPMLRGYFKKSKSPIRVSFVTNRGLNILYDRVGQLMKKWMIPSVFFLWCDSAMEV